MASHEFGLLPRDPAPGERYDAYEPERYHCIAVDDEWIAPLAEKLKEVPVYWHTLDRPGTGLAYCGVTLIPPESIPGMLAALGSAAALRPLRFLLEQAASAHRFLIHYGL